MTRTGWLWGLVIAALILLLLVWWFDPFHRGNNTTQTGAQASPSPTDYYRPAPSGAAVPVTLPETTVVPAPAPSATPSGTGG